MSSNIETINIIKEISGVNPLRCMKCGKCTASCMAYDEMDIKPHQFVSYIERGDLESLMLSESLYKCLGCFACVERCPRNVQPGKLIDAVRQTVIRQRGAEGMTTEEIRQLITQEVPQQLLVSAFRRNRR